MLICVVFQFCDSRIDHFYSHKADGDAFFSVLFCFLSGMAFHGMAWWMVSRRFSQHQKMLQDPLIPYDPCFTCCQISSNFISASDFCFQTCVFFTPNLMCHGQKNNGTNQSHWAMPPRCHVTSFCRWCPRRASSAKGVPASRNGDGNNGNGCNGMKRGGWNSSICLTKITICKYNIQLTYMFFLLLWSVVNMFMKFLYIEHMLDFRLSRSS